MKNPKRPHRQYARSDVLAHLTRPMRAVDLAEILNADARSVRVCLTGLKEVGEVNNDSNGLWFRPDSAAGVRQIKEAVLANRKKCGHWAVLATQVGVSA